MGLKAEVENLDSVEEAFHSLYTEKDGKYVLTGVEGLVPATEVAKVKTEAGGYRIKLKESTTALEAYKALGTVAEVQEKLDKFPELELLAAGKMDDKKIDALVEQRVNGKLTPVVRERDALKTANAELLGQVESFKTEKKQRTMSDQIRSAAVALKMLPEAIDDAILYGERALEIGDDGVAVVKDQGLSVKDWLTDMQAKRPHWWGGSVGGGANGNRGNSGFTGNNPWTAEHWNMTTQGQIVRQDRKRADSLASAAGTTVGGAKPAPRAK
jgi:hypothetical protein